jgi:hypothetical protein
VVGAIAKTDNLLRIRRLPLGLLVKNEENPNKMKPREFDLLCDNMNETGWTDPVLARPVDFKALSKIASKAKDETHLVDAMVKDGVTLRIVGGHHRFDAGSFLGFEYAPVTVIMDPGFDEEKERFQLVRMNTIHGKLDPQAFFKMYSSLSQKYSNDILQDAFGFAEEAEFQRLIAQTAKLLPDKSTQEKYKEAAKEIKTIDGLAKLLNEMFAKYGDTLPYGFMVFDHAGQRSMWLRIEGKTMQALDVIADICIDRQRTVDDLIGTVLQLIARGDQKEFIDSIVAETPEAKLPKHLQAAPTKEHLAKVSALA